MRGIVVPLLQGFADTDLSDQTVHACHDQDDPEVSGAGRTPGSAGSRR